MIKRVLSSLPLVFVFGLMRVQAGSFNQITFSGDATSGFSSALTYTARADFNGNGTRTINGVALTETGLSGTNYTLSGPGNGFTGFTGNTTTGTTNAALSDFNFTGDGSGNASMTLSGLTVGQRYVTTWNNAAFGGPGGRVIAITPSDTGLSYSFDQNFSGANNGNLLRYVFTATATSITYNFDAAGNNDSFHHYAFSNALLTSSGPVINSVSGTAPGFSPYTVSNNDLLQTSLAGAPVSSNAFNQEGTQLSALNNGTFVINGSGNNGQLASASNNAFVEFPLDVSTNLLGYDVSAINLYGGWNDAGRDRQLVNISYSTVGSTEWIPFDFLDFDPSGVTGASAVSALFTASLTGVDGVRFDFPNLQENGYAGIGEIDVIGAATIPEPAVSGFAGLVVLLGFVRRRRC